MEKHLKTFQGLSIDGLLSRKSYFETLIGELTGAGIDPNKIESIHRLEAINHLLEERHG